MVICFRLPPLASEVKISGSPEREAENASLAPSLDHAGESVVPTGELKLTGRPDTVFYNAKGEHVYTKVGPYSNGAELEADIKKYALSKS